MFRALLSLLILCLAAASVDAATHVGAFLPNGPDAAQEAHEAHEFHSGHDAPAPDGKPHHFCHCGVHSPAFTTTVEIVVSVVNGAEHRSPEPLLGALRLPPPLRPPNAA